MPCNYSSSLVKNEPHILSVFAKNKRRYETFQGNLKESLGCICLFLKIICAEIKDIKKLLCPCVIVSLCL